MTRLGARQVGINDARSLEAGCGDDRGYGGKLSSACDLGAAGGLGNSHRVTTVRIPSRGDAASFCGGTADGFGKAHDLGNNSSGDFQYAARSNQEEGLGTGTEWRSG